MSGSIQPCTDFRTRSKTPDRLLLCLCWAQRWEPEWFLSYTSAFGLWARPPLLSGGRGCCLAVMNHLPSLRTKFGNENLCYALKF